MPTDGLFTVTFSSRSQAGAGVAIITGNTVRGGDSGYYYAGELRQEPTAGTYSVLLEVVQHNAQVPSIFGPRPRLQLELRGSISGTELTLDGSVVGASTESIRIQGRRVK